MQNNSIAFQQYKKVKAVKKSNVVKPQFISGMTRSKSHKNFLNQNVVVHNPIVIPKVTFQKEHSRKIKRIKSSKMMIKKVRDFEDEGQFPRKVNALEEQYQSHKQKKKLSLNQELMNSYKQMVKSIFKEENDEDLKKNLISEKNGINRNKSISNFNNSKNYHRKKVKQDMIERYVRHNRNKSLVESVAITDNQSIAESRFNHETNEFHTDVSNKLFKNPSNLCLLQPSSFQPVPQKKLPLVSDFLDREEQKYISLTKSKDQSKSEDFFSENQKRLLEGGIPVD